VTEKIKNLHSLISELRDAVDLITRSAPLHITGITASEIKASKEHSLKQAMSLIEYCENLSSINKSKKPYIRVVHHLACSGGTIFSKCIAALPNVYLLSEANPFSPIVNKDSPSFSPTDIPSLAKFAAVPEIETLSNSIFKNNVAEINNYIESIGGRLVVRYHTHTDYNTSKNLPDENHFDKLFSQTCNVLSVLTIRNPLDAYTSLKKNGWVHFKPQTFEEYCRRYLLHLSHFKKENIYRYEDFVEDPKDLIEQAARKLELSFDESFLDIFAQFNLTGDSGRKSDFISARESRVDEDLLREASQSESYKKICELGWYQSS